MSRRDNDYTVFFQAEYERVVRSVRLMVGDQETALDISQEAFARLFTKWWRISRYDKPDAWVRRIAVNLAITHLRRSKVRRRALALITPRIEYPIEERRPDVAAAVRELPPMQRAAVILFYFEDQPSSEIAQILGCSESTVRVHLHNARRKLATQLHDDSEETVDVTR